jgi:hypothetical protein
MINLRQVKQAGKLRTKTSLEPIIRNVTRWSSTYEMLKRFFRIQEFIDKSDETLAMNMPSAMEMIALKDAMRDLEQFQCTTILLQDVKRNLADVRSIFDEMLDHYPTMDHYLASYGGIVHSPDFESAIVKVIDDDTISLNNTEKALLQMFSNANNQSGVSISPVKPDTPFTLKKKERLLTTRMWMSPMYLQHQTLWKDFSVLPDLFLPTIANLCLHILLNV